MSVMPEEEFFFGGVGGAMRKGEAESALLVGIGLISLPNMGGGSSD